MKKPSPNVHTKMAAVLKSEWMQPWQLQDYLTVSAGVMMSESSVGRRLRELREPKHGNHTLLKRPAGKGSKAFEYHIKKGGAK